MKQKKLLLSFLLFTLIISLAIQTSYSQWIFCPGSAQMTGLGTDPAISCLDANNVIVAGGVPGSPKVYRSTNGGIGFVNITGNISGVELYTACMLNINTYIVGDGGPNAKLWRTTDAGLTWTNVLTTGGSSGFFNGIVQASTMPGFVVAHSDGASSTTMYVSSNSGANWTSQTMTGGYTQGTIGSVFCIDNMFYGVGIGGSTRISYTTNGSNFNTILLGLSGSGITGFAFNDNKQNGLAASGQLPNIAQTTNGPGGSWQQVNTGSGTSVRNIMRWAPNSNICFLATTSPTQTIRISTNNGNSWTGQTTSGITNISDITIQRSGLDVIGFAIAYDGSVIRLLTPLGIQTTNNEIPDKFVLEQNYPNPFNPVTNINYSLPVFGWATLKIYNSIGMFIAEPVNQQHSPGTYTVDFNAENFASGVYYYTMTAGEFTETKKMILIK